MKNPIFVMCAFLLLGLSSCQKENLNPQSDTTEPVANVVDRGDGTGYSSVTNSGGGGTIGSGTTTNGGGGTTTTNGGSDPTISPTYNGSTTGSWSKIVLCDQNMLVSRTQDPATGERYLYIADANGNPQMKFTYINQTMVPDQVMVSVKPYFTGGFEMGATWISTSQDVTYYLAESWQSPGILVLATKEGEVTCEGTKQ